jgi:tartrate-resistant acid phosphatase type 5
MNMFCAVSITFLSTSAYSQTESVRFAAFGDYGVNNVNEQSVADLVEGWNPDFIITTGDNSYWSTPIDDNVGKYYSQYIGDYSGSYGAGSLTNRFFPTLGNHGYTDGGGISAYLNYFTLPGAGVISDNSSGKEHYYDFVQGPLHFFALNSNFQESDGNNSASAQAQWLQTQLALSAAKWKIVYMHHPPYSSARHGSQSVMQWPYEDWGVTAVIAGHDHTYERITRDDNLDSKDFPYFVTGLGGRSSYLFPPENLVSGSQVRYNSANGSMLIDATNEQIVFRFYSVTGGSAGTLIDSFAITDPVTDVSDDKSVLPEAFALGQNYPNPFNPTTVITYSLPAKADVTLTVYNLLGQIVKVFKQGEQFAGEHSVTWNATDVNGRAIASGIYFYRLTSGDYAATRKMVLLR